MEKEIHSDNNDKINNNKDFFIFSLVGLILVCFSTIIYMFIGYYTVGKAKLILLIGLMLFVVSAFIFSIFGFTQSIKSIFILSTVGMMISVNMFLSIFFQIFQNYIF